MTKVVAFNGSPRMEKGNTAMILSPFLQAMTDAGCDVDLFYASKLKIKPCNCGVMDCWNRTPGQCRHEDDMTSIYPLLEKADILVLATPVYVPLPGRMQEVINRLCPLLEPVLETRDGRTRARMRKSVGIDTMALVSTGGWWEKENLDTVVRIVEELAENSSVRFAGAVLRPHVDVLGRRGVLTNDGKAILEAVGQAGRELATKGVMSPETLKAVSRPLIPREDYLRIVSKAGA